MSHSVVCHEAKITSLMVVALAMLLQCGCMGLNSRKAAGEHFELHYGAPVRLTSGPGNDTEAAWSPDGNSIAFQRELKGDLDIELLDLLSGKI